MKERAASGDRLRGAWTVVAVSFLLLFGAAGTQMSFGIFLKPLADEFGWARGAAAGAMSVLMVVSGLVGILMGRVADRYGTRVAVVPGVVAGAVSYLLVSRIGALWQFYLLFGLGGGILAGCANTPAVSAVSRAFGPERRTLAIGTLFLGSVAGQMVLSPVIAASIGAVGWRSTWLVMAGAVFACGVPAIAVLGGKRLPEGSGADNHGPARAAGTPDTGSDSHGLTWQEACRTSAFWILIWSGILLGLGSVAFSSHVVAYAGDEGVSEATAALVLTISALGMAVGTIAAGPLTTRMGYRWALVGLSALHGAALCLFALAGDAWSFDVLGVVVGFAFAALIPVRMGLLGPFFGLRAVGTLVGLVAFSFSVGAIGGGFATGFIFDAAGSYDPAFLAFGGLMLVGALAQCFLRAPTGAASAATAPEGGDLAGEGQAGIIA